MYRVDDICWDITPKSTFTNSRGKEISFLEYYKTQYSIEIQDVDQPMLLHVDKKRKAFEAEPEERYICLVPELCTMTGLTDNMKNNFSVSHLQFEAVVKNKRIRLFSFGVKLS